MARFRDQVIHAGFETLHRTRLHEILTKFCGGVGSILTFHHVRPARLDAFQPNRLLEITPEFLGDVVGIMRRADIDLISLDEMQRRMVSGHFERRFACITFDDGYRDNKVYAYPILKKHNVPFAIYVPTSFIERRGELWWLALEQVIASNDHLTMRMGENTRSFNAHTPEEKQRTFSEIYWWLRGLREDDEIRNAVRELVMHSGIDLAETYDSLSMTWREITELATDPLVTIGAHTLNHPILAKTPAEVARREIEAGAAEIARVLGRWPSHLSYPFGDSTSAGQREFAIARELGFKTAVTTRPGVLFPEHRDCLMALPRLSINGEYQDARYVEVLLSGAATALWNGFRRVNAA
jgi:peptidoglycan/xylan/chitin deacetylase (PgdA/CDA1 family)